MKTNATQRASQYERGICNAKDGVTGEDNRRIAGPIGNALERLGQSVTDLTTTIAGAEAKFETVLSEPIPLDEVPSDPAVSHLHASLLTIDFQVRTAVVRLLQLVARSTL